MKRILVLVIMTLALVNAGLSQDKTQFSLQECIEFSIKNNPTLKNAWFDMKVAENNKMTRFSSWLPVINGNMSISSREDGPTHFLGNTFIKDDTTRAALGLTQITKSDNYGYSFSLDMNLLDLGVSYNNFRKINTDYKAKFSGYENQLQQTILSIVEKYYDLVKQQKILEARQKAVERSEEQDRRAETMYQLGATAKVDMYRAKVNLGNDKMAFLQQQNALENAKHQLNLAMGEDPFAEISISDELRPELSLEELTVLKTEMEGTNPSLLNLKHSLASSKYNKYMSFGNMFPSIGAFVRWNRYVPDNEFFFKDFDQEYNYTYGISLNFNLFNGFRDHVNHQNAKIAEKMANENLRQQTQQLLSQLKYYYNQFNTYKEIRETNLLNILATQEEYKLADERFKIGSGTSLELRDAQVRLSNAEQLLIESDYQLVLTKNQIQALLGRLKK
ncbi:MAG: TolC family protein [Calditrichia bacterium]|nr:TolC family protein [Calditrichia bacterium]